MLESSGYLELPELKGNEIEVLTLFIFFVSCTFSDIWLISDPISPFIPSYSTCWYPAKMLNKPVLVVIFSPGMKKNYKK
jgi:hypothetical protein